jgi:glycosyltransferase involved in cell wall biosynthesis
MLHRRKNIANLLRAFDSFKSNNDSNVKLLIVGHRKWWTNEMEETYKNMSHAQDVVFTGRLPIEELVEVTASALALTYVSYFEGFGVPIIESMRAGVPVITADVTSMPEVAQDAAVLCDPFSTESIAQSMKAIWYDPALRARCIDKGLARAQDFSWNKTADLLWDCLIKARG